jgi:4-carboxymuconolactone decarboxylase
MVKAEEIVAYLDSLDLTGHTRRVRLLAILSAVLALCRPRLTRAILAYLRKRRIEKSAIYETILQSYLFLGFPRAIEGIIIFEGVFFSKGGPAGIRKKADRNIQKWQSDGDSLCRVVYGKNYDALRQRFTHVAPELFEWMVIEGYGKVLSRPGLSRIERELAEVAALIVDGRERQLVSHILGSLNVGASITLVRRVNDDIAPLTGQNRRKMADRIISRIESRYAAAI